MDTTAPSTSSPVVAGSRPGEDWRHQAACVGLDFELFFPLGEGYATVDQTQEAKSVCGRCPVNQPCLEWALETGLEFGIFGGRTESERRRLRAELRLGRPWG